MTPKALEDLKARLALLTDLRRTQGLLSWDSQVLMPTAAAPVRGEQRATLDRLAHELFVSPETERLLAELEPYAESLDPDSHDARLIAVTREDFEKQSRVPGELRAEMARLATTGYEVWRAARPKSDFEAFRPYLEQQFEVRQRYIDCFPPADERYDVLLDDFERGMKTAEVRGVFERAKEELVPLIAEASEAYGDDDGILDRAFPEDAQIALSKEVLELFGHRENAWRLDPTVHPFAIALGIDDIRVTTKYEDTGLHSLFATMHEYGHGLYEHQIDKPLERTPLARGVSYGMHESQSRLWENLVGRSRPFWRFFYPRLQAHFPEQLREVDLDSWYRAINRVERSLIRIESDEVTYNMHIILRFELEQEVVNGTVEVRDLPDEWNDRMNRYLGVEVPSDRDGVLQDVHWGVGHIGYFSTYSLGNIMSVQIWEKINDDLPELEEHVERADFAPLREWLREHIHQHGRKYRPQDTLERAVGSRIDPEPYLRYLRDKHGAAALA